MRARRDCLHFEIPTRAAKAAWPNGGTSCWCNALGIAFNTSSLSFDASMGLACLKIMSPYTSASGPLHRAR